MMACEFVFLNHVNICGRILQLTPKNGTNLAIFELTRKTHRLNQFPKVILTQETVVLVLVFGWRDSFMSRAKPPGATQC
jgi:hypothetical protein